jgi:hypothetical protein
MRRLVALLLALLVAAACSGGDDDDDAEVAETTTTAPLHAEDELEDGRHFGFVTALDPAQFRLVFDEAELLEGEEAVAAAEEDGGVVTPEGSYVRNPDDRMNRVTLSEDIEVRLIAEECCELEEVPFEDWLAGFDASDERAFFGTAKSHYWLTIEDEKVVAVEEQHVP